MISGKEATDFAIKVGFQKTSLRTNRSDEEHLNWIRNGRKPNYWKNGFKKIEGHDTIGSIIINKIRYCY